MLIRQEENGRDATELFIKAAAVLLGVDIHITSEISRTSDPYVKLSRFWGESNNCMSFSPNMSYEEVSSIQPILLGSLHEVHFQSLLPFHHITFPQNFNISGSSLNHPNPLPDSTKLNPADHDKKADDELILLYPLYRLVRKGIYQ